MVRWSGSAETPQTSGASGESGRRNGTGGPFACDSTPGALGSPWVTLASGHGREGDEALLWDLRREEGRWRWGQRLA